MRGATRLRDPISAVRGATARIPARTGGWRSAGLGAVVALCLLAFPAAGRAGEVASGPVAAASQPGSRQTADDWLRQIGVAARTLNYSGIFVTQHGPELSTSRLVHFVLPQGDFERIETLDGQRRVMAFLNDEVRTSWPDYHLMLIDDQPGRVGFPGLLKVHVGDVDRNYRLEPGDDARCAGYRCQVATIVPRDDLRWGYRLWALRDSHLLVKAQTINSAGRVVNQVAFTQLRLNVSPDRRLVQASMHPPAGYTVEKMQAVPVDLASQGWGLSAPLPGFRTVGAYRRSMTVGGKSSDVLQWLLSDGLASVSIFIQPAAGLSEPVPREQRVGGTLAVSRPVADSWVTVMGAVPERTLHRLSAAVVRIH
jgi:sigma-E factor negative regulatory protein RseB